MSQDYHHSDVALSDEFHDAPDTYTPDDHSQPQFHHDQYDDEVQENQYDDDDYQDEDEEDEDQFHDSDPGVEEELTDPIHAQQLGEEHDLQLPVDHEQPLHASGSASDLHPASLPVQPDNGSSAAPLLSPSASDSRAPPSSEHDAVAQQTPALQSLSTPPADPNLPQVIVTSTSPQHTPDGPPDPSQPIASPPQPAQPQSPSPQVVVVPQAAAAPSPTTAPAPQVILQSPPPVVQPQIVQPQLQQSFTAAVPMAYPGVPMMSLQSDFTEQNIATVYNNLTSALVGHPPPPTAGPSYLPPTPTSLPPSTLPPPQHSPPRARSRSPAPPDLAPSQPPSRANSGARAGPSQNRSPRTPRTSQTSGARVAVPGKRTSPPRRLSDNAQTPTTPTNVAPPPSNRNSALYQPTPVTTPIAEHPEYDLYESPTQEAQRGHARAASAQAAAHVQDEVPPPPPPAYLKPVSRPPSVYVSERATGHDPNILTQSPLTSPGLSPAPPVHSGRFEQQQQQQPPHIVRRAATTGHSGHPQQTRPIYERRGRSYDDETQHSPPSGQLPQRSASIHASIPVGGIVNGQTILAQAHAPGAELDLTPSGIHMNLNVNAGELPGADAVRRDVSALRNQGAEFVREQSNVVRQHGADVYNQGLEAVRQGTNLYAQSADAVRQGVNSVRSGAEGLRQGATRTVSFLGDAQRGLDVNTLAAGAGSLAAGYLMGGHGGQGNGHASPQHISPQHTSGNGVGNGNGNPGMTMEGYLSRQSGLDTFVPVVGAKNVSSQSAGFRSFADSISVALLIAC
ncbi:hypothetical protein BXZ70DRAFT_515282 [Cristinia sonorae]|uniref:Uncharacterized protein n=1 Tax=Cristinia sonorae TaxID=1940300 RepID=A0A8K0UWJ3_9AGAR|nr:hypothetical protein BXZ70DRAFT_515282 [Cristinia sonorae]